MMNNHGGKREGAGRPNLGRKRRTLYLSEIEYIKLKQYLEKLRSKKN